MSVTKLEHGADLRDAVLTDAHLVTTPATIGALQDALALPDVSGIATDDLSPADLATLAYSLEQQIANAARMFAEICAPVRAMMEQARARVKGAIIDDGGTMLAHDTFDVLLSQRYERDKRLEILRTLKDVLPDDLYAKAVHAKAIAGTLDPKMIELAEQTPGCKVQWDADLRKLDVYARKYGGEIAKIVEAGSPRVEIGQAVLVIRPRESAIKTVTQ